MTGYAPLVSLAARALRPLLRATTDPDAMGRLLAMVGWVTAPDEASVARLGQLLPVDALERVAELAGSREDGGSVDPSAVAELTDLVAGVVHALDGWASLTEEDVSDLPAGLADPELWADLTASLPTVLLVDALDAEYPLVATLLRLTGVLSVERAPQDAIRRHAAHWERLPDALTDPLGAAAETVSWQEGFRAEPVLRELRLLLARLGVTTSLHPASQELLDAVTSGGQGQPTTLLESEVLLLRGMLSEGVAAQVGLLLASAETATGSTGLYVGNLAYGQLSAPVEVARGWTLTVEGEVTGTATIGAVLRPGQLTVVGTTPSAEVAVRLEGRPERPWRLVGGSDGSRLELAAVDVVLGLTVEGDRSELWLELVLPDRALALLLDFGAADGFLRSAVGSTLPAVEVAGGLRLGSRSGLTLTSGTGLVVTLPVDLQLGPVHVASLTAAVGSDGGAGTVRLTVAVDATVGPFAAQLGGIGACLALSGDPAGDGLAGLDAVLDFVPPSRIALALDLEGVVTGGGFLDHDADSGRWTGALALEALGVGLAAVVVVDTALPEDPDGWAFFASISATFPSLPLGFGFFLSGVGGILGLDRAMDVEALAGALRDGAVDAVLFPDDPLADAPLILAQLDAWFPPAPGSTVLGVAATVDWGAPVALVTGQLGVLLSLPELELAVLGSISLVLPSPDTPLIELHLDTLGTIDPAEGVISVLASLYDSTLLSTIHLSGDMAMYASLGTDPYFLLSVGGFHPQFHPRAGLPSSMAGLRRMRAEVAIGPDVCYALESYVALTSNSLQFGAEASLEATARFLSSTYTARGSVGFDVLLVFSPFRFMADFDVSVAVTSGNDKELLAVGLSAHLEGPQPWRAAGTARFTFLFIDVRFAVEFGGSAGAEAPPGVLLLDQLVGALGEVRSWAGTVPTGADGGAVSTVQAPGDVEELWARPDGGLEVRQGVAPLDRRLDRYGSHPIDGPTTFTLDGAEIGPEGRSSVEWEPVVDWFVPVQFDDLDETAKLTAPSYEEMVAGVRFGATSTSVTGDASDTAAVRPGYEVGVLEPEATRGLGRRPLAVPLLAAARSLVTDPRRRRLTGRAVAATRFEVRSTTWVLADSLTGEPSGAPRTHREATLARRRSALADPGRRGSVRVAPAAAVPVGMV